MYARLARRAASVTALVDRRGPLWVGLSGRPKDNRDFVLGYIERAPEAVPVCFIQKASL